jgi:hypothetical protein
MEFGRIQFWSKPDYGRTDFCRIYILWMCASRFALHGILPNSVLLKSVLPKSCLLKNWILPNSVLPKSGFAGMYSNKVRSTKVWFYQSPVCSKMIFYQIPFYQSPVLPKSGLLKNRILANSVLPKSVPPIWNMVMGVTWHGDFNSGVSKDLTHCWMFT